MLLQTLYQQEALECLDALAEQIDASLTSSEEEVWAWRATVGQARELVARVIKARGSAHMLLAGRRMGFAIAACAVASKVDHHAWRFLLPVEARNVSRSLYSRRQIRMQVLAPARSVVLVSAGILRHQQRYPRTECHHVGVVWIERISTSATRAAAIFSDPLQALL